MQRNLRRIAGRVARSVVFIAASVYAGLCALIYGFQEKLIFRPAPLPENHAFAIADTTEVKVTVDGAQLSALHFRLPNPTGLVFFLHGNGGNLASWLTSTDFYRRANYDLFMIDYRGYGKSSGKITSEEQLHADVRAAWDFIAPRYAGRKVVIYGRSLGTGLAARLAAEVPADLTVLVSPFASILDMGQQIYPWLPGFLSRYPMRSDLFLPRVKSPVLILHGDQDELIPLEQGRKLKASRPGAELLVIEGAAHNDIHKFPSYLDALAGRLQRI